MILKKFTDSRRVRQGMSFLTAAFLIGSISFLGVSHYNSSNALTGASMQLTPASGSYAAGSNVSFTIREDSGSIPINSVQASLTYNPSQLQFVSITEGGAFPLVAATSTGQAGVIRVARAIQGTPQTGDRPVVTVNFKVLTAGTAAVTIDRAFSSVVRANDSQNVLEAVTNGSYTMTSGTATPPPATSPSPQPTSGTGKPVLNLQPNGGTYAPGATIPVAVRVNSPSTRVTVVRGVVKYPSNLLEFVDSRDSSTFPTANQLKKGTDTVDFTRGIAGGGSGVTGDNLVVTLNFKVKANAGSLPLTFTGASEVYDNSGSGQNILDLMGSKGTLYGISATATPPPPQSSAPSPQPSSPSPAPAQNTGTKPIVRAQGALTITPTKSSSASISSDNTTQIAGTVELAAVANPNVLAANPGDAIVKVEYSINKELVATKTEEPFSHAFDTTKLKNGTYLVTVKTYYKSGTVDTNTDNLQVKNPVTLSYVMANYSVSILGSVIGLVIIALVAWKFLLPRFLGGGEMATETAQPMSDTFTTPAAPAEEQSSWEGIAPDPTVVAPTAPADNANAPVGPDFSTDQSATVLTQPLDMQNPQVVTSTAPTTTVQAPEPTSLTQTPSAPQQSTPIAPAEPPVAAAPLAADSTAAPISDFVFPVTPEAPQAPPASAQPVVPPVSPTPPTTPQFPPAAPPQVPPSTPPTPPSVAGPSGTQQPPQPR